MQGAYGWLCFREIPIADEGGSVFGGTHRTTGRRMRTRRITDRRRRTRERARAQLRAASHKTCGRSAARVQYDWHQRPDAIHAESRRATATRSVEIADIRPMDKSPPFTRLPSSASSLPKTSSIIRRQPSADRLLAAIEESLLPTSTAVDRDRCYTVVIIVIIVTVVVTVTAVTARCVTVVAIRAANCRPSGSPARRKNDRGIGPAHFPAVKCTAVAAFLVLLQSANLVQTARATGDTTLQGPPHDAAAVVLTEIGRNIIKGLKLEKLPDMNKVS